MSGPEQTQSKAKKTRQFQRVDKRLVRELLGGLRLQPRDERILNELARHRFLSVEHLHYLIQPDGSYRKLGERLQKLFHYVYVDRPKKQVNLWPSQGGRNSYVYGLGDEGAKHLAPKLSQAGRHIPLGASYWTKVNREAGEPYLAHTLMINDFLVALVRSLTKTDLELNWHSEGEWPPDGEHISTRVKGPRGGTVYIPIRPDAFFTLSFNTPRGRTTRHFFLEADQATMPGKRLTKGLVGTSIYKKLLGYWHWFRRKGHHPFGLPGFIVLTTTTTLDRASNLRAIARQVDDKQRGSHMFWFTAASEYENPKQILSDIWLSAGDDPDAAERFHSLTESSQTTR